MTKRIAIAELEGVALDWAVAEIAYPNDANIQDKAYEFACDYAFSRDWSQCGPLIERHITALNQSGYGWWAHSGNHLGEGVLPLIAACRAIVAAHNPSGFVEVPDELVEGD